MKGVLVTEYTTHRGLPYPSGESPVVVHEDIESLAIKADVELNAAAAEIRELKKGAVPPGVENLFSHDQTVPGILSAAGEILPHDTNYTSEFIPVTGGITYSSWAAAVLHRIVFFDDNQDHISGTPTNWMIENEIHHWSTPVNAAYARVGVSPITSTAQPTIIFNRGSQIWEPDRLVSSGWWEDRERPPLAIGEVGIENLSFARHGLIESQYIDGAVPHKVTNLINMEDTVLGTLAPDGNIVEHPNNRVSEYIPITPEQHYVSWSNVLTRVVFFDKNQTGISGTNTTWLAQGQEHVHQAPANARYARVGVSPVSLTETQVTFNEGTERWEPGKDIKTGWWDDRELPPGTGDATIDDRKIQDIVDSLLPQWEPSPPTLSPETVSTGNAHPLWMNSDGTMLYGRNGWTLIQSSDEWATREVVHQFPIYIMGVRTLNDGELLVATAGNFDTQVIATVYKSQGYDPSDPTAATWVEVLQSGSQRASINNEWGMQVYQNVVILGEYGLRGEQGSRRVWMSEDHGDTYNLVFDLKSVDAPGRPEWSDTAHLHTPVWDPYWNRLWVVVGDGQNTASYYSDDKGDTWTFIEGSDQVQFTGIMPLPGAVIFGSDAGPNGVHVYRRGLKTDMPKITPLLVIDDHPTLTRVFTLPFKRDWEPETPTYFVSIPANATMPPSMLVATIDGRKAHQLWEGTRPDSGAEFSGNLIAALGPTNQGNIILTMTDDPTATNGGRIMKAPAPSWARV